jgi:hypothetical protein
VPHRTRTFSRSGTGTEILLADAGRLLGALGDGDAFPQDQAGLEALFDGVAEEPGDSDTGFVFEPPDEPPSYSNAFDTWVRPAGEGRVRLRSARADLTSLIVTLGPDGRFGEVETLNGFGVPAQELTGRAREEHEAYERRVARSKEIDWEARRAEGERRDAERRDRWRLHHLLRTIAGPDDQDPAGPVLGHVDLYDTGVVVCFLLPRPDEAEFDPEDRQALNRAVEDELEFELADGRGTAFRLEVGHLDRNGQGPLRVRRQLTPAVAPDAERLRVTIGAATVELELGSR